MAIFCLFASKINMNDLNELPLSTGEFKVIRKENYLYVDKTEYLLPLIQKRGKKIFFRRPRRFGKSLTISTLEALLQGHKELFKGLWIYDKWNWTPHGVIRLDFSMVDGFFDRQTLLNSINQLLRVAGQKNNIELSGSTWEQNFDQLIIELSKRGPVAVLIDEYDCPWHNILQSDESFQQLTMQCLSAFYRRLKAFEQNLGFLFVTGITKIAKASVFSGMNSMEDVSLEPQYAALCGVTQAELESVFGKHIDHMAIQTNCTRHELLDDLKSMYNGYRFSPESVTRVYNPFSLNHALKYMKLRHFWFQTGTPTLLINLIKKNDFDLSFLNDLKLSGAEMTKSYEFSAMTLKLLLYEAGYLTIEGDLSENEELIRSRKVTGFPLTFPNEEVRVAFASSILDSIRDKPTSDEEMNQGEMLVDALKEGRWEDFTEIWNQLLSNIPYNLHIPLESYYHSLFMLFAMLFGFEAQSERKNSVGLLDMAVELSDRIFIIEFKLNSPASLALKQIHNKRYFEIYKVKNKPIFLVGISFDSKLKQIAEVKLEDLQSKQTRKIYKLSKTKKSQKS